MKERLTTLAGSIGALLLFVMLLSPVGRDAADGHSRPHTSDDGASGYWALHRWAESSGVPTFVLRRRYTSLPGETGISATGNLIVITLPQISKARHGELEDLADWLSNGNDALIVMAIGDHPQWRLRAEDNSTDDLLEIVGFELVATETAESDAHGGDKSAGVNSPIPDISETAVELHPIAGHPLTRGITKVTVTANHALDDGLSIDAIDRGRIWLGLLQAGERPVLWETVFGNGRLWLSRYSSLLSNAHIAKDGNARLASNLVAVGLGPGGTLIFDDMHQGVSSLYDSKAFFRDPRLWNSLLFVIGAWLLWVAARAQRLAPLRLAPPERHATDYVRAVGGLLARRMTEPAVARALLTHFFDDVRTLHHLPPSGSEDWELLNRLYHGPPRDLERLRAMAHRIESARSVNLSQFTLLLARIREHLP